jgi:hypothetical protein
MWTQTIYTWGSPIPRHSVNVGPDISGHRDAIKGLKGWLVIVDDPDVFVAMDTLVSKETWVYRMKS